MKDHAKSRRGCLRCKQRKVKCDETLPSCQRCFRRREHCSYLSSYAASLPPTPGQFLEQPCAGPATAVAQYGDGGGGDTSSYLIDLDLTHHFLTSTYETLWERPEAQVIWRDVVFQEGLRYRPLLDGVLATAALHKIITDRDGASHHVLRGIALRKQTSALEGLRSLLQTINPDTSDTVFILAILVSIWAFASRLLPPELDILSNDNDITPSLRPAFVTATPKGTAIVQFISLLQRIRPMSAVHRVARPWLRQGKLRGFLRVPSLEDMCDVPADVANALDELEIHVRRDPSALLVPPEAHPIHLLRRVFRRPPWTEQIIAWLVQLPEPFSEEIELRNDAVLTLVSYWAVSFHAISGRWWLQGWAEALIIEIEGSVKGEWARLAQWPRIRLGL